MKKSKLLLAAGILGTCYLLYLVVYFAGDLISPSSATDVIASGLATALVTPHMVCVGVAVVFNWLGWALKAPWAALVAGILYAVSMVCMFLYALFVALQMIFCFVAFARMKHSQTRPVTRIGYWQKDRP